MIPTYGDTSAPPIGPSREERLVAYRCATLVAIVNSRKEREAWMCSPTDCSFAAWCARNAEEYAQAMLAAERP